MRSGMALWVLNTALLLAAAAAATVWDVPSANTVPREKTAQRETDTLSDAAQLAASLTLEEKVGQLFLIGHWTATGVATTARRIAQYRVGGVLLMDAPARPADIAEWTRQWRGATGIPPIFAIDQEGGEVSRIRAPGYIQTPQPQITATATAYAVGKTRGAELRALGIHLNLAPVVDRATRADAYLRNRVFPAESIVPLSAAYIAGMRTEGVASAIKHFPGHPDTPEDSHVVLPVIRAAKEEAAAYLAPFRETLRRARPAAVMAGHILFPALDAQFPATVSRTLLTEVLRERWGYEGVILTDDLIMRGLGARYTPTEAAIAALAAGADMVMLAAKPELIARVYPAVVAAYRNGTLSRSALQQSVARILALKKKAGIPIPLSPSAPPPR